MTAYTVTARIAAIGLEVTLETEAADEWKARNVFSAWVQEDYRSRGPLTTGHFVDYTVVAK